MDEEEVIVAIGFFIAAATSIKIIASAFLRTQEMKFKYGSGRTPVEGEVAARMERMEQALDSIAIEVERISENQRYTTRLLTEREASPHRLSS